MAGLIFEVQTHAQGDSDDPGSTTLPLLVLPESQVEKVRAKSGSLPPQTQVISLGQDGCRLVSLNGHSPQELPTNQWHELDGWRLRIRPGKSARSASASDQNMDELGGVSMNSIEGDFAMTLADLPTWASPEIRVEGHPDLPEDGTKHALPVEEGSKMIIGRSRESVDLILHDRLVSRQHLRFSVRGGQQFVEDLGSRWGTTLNDQKLEPNVPRPLRHNDVIQMGKTKLHYSCYWEAMKNRSEQAEEERAPAGQEATPSEMGLNQRPGAGVDPSEATMGPSSGSGAKALADQADDEELVPEEPEASLQEHEPPAEEQELADDSELDEPQASGGLSPWLIYGGLGGLSLLILLVIGALAWLVLQMTSETG
jgi:hypothetical protein